MLPPVETASAVLQFHLRKHEVGERVGVPEYVETGETHQEHATIGPN